MGIENSFDQYNKCENESQLNDSKMDDELIL